MRGPFATIATSVPGVRIAEPLPGLARRLDRVAIIRSMTSPLGEHNLGSHYLLTGYQPTPALDIRAMARSWRTCRAARACCPPTSPYPASPAEGPGYLPAPRGRSPSGATRRSPVSASATSTRSRGWTASDWSAAGLSCRRSRGSAGVPRRGRPRRLRTIPSSSRPTGWHQNFAVGMPHQRTGRRVMLPMPAARVWFHEYLIKKGERKAQPASLSEARMRKETAQAALEELKLARELGKLMLVDEFSQLLGEAYGRVRAKLLNFPARAAGVAFGTTSFADCQAKLHPLVLEIMAELAAADDVPDPDAETAPA